MNELLAENWFVWAIIIVISFPISAILMGQVVTSLRRRNHPLEKVARFSLNVLLPLLAIFLTMNYVLELGAVSTSVRIVLTMVLMAAIYILLAFFNAVVFATGDENSWRSRMPKLLRDLILVILVGAGGVIVLATVWQQNVAGLFAALGVGSIVLGFALQETIGNVMLGISLLMERPFSEGDWVQVGDVEGEIAQINWRSVRIITRTGDTVIIPHSVAAASVVTNNTQPNSQDRTVVTLGFGYEHPPNKVKDMIMEAMIGTPGILLDPPPKALTKEYADSSVNYIAAYTIEHPREKFKVKDAFMTRIWYASQRHGINIPFPIRTVYNFDGEKSQKDLTRAAIEEVRSSVLLRDMMSSDYLDAHGKGAKFQHFGIGEEAIQQGDTTRRLYLIVSGEAKVVCRHASGHASELFTLSRGDFFGEITLFTGAPSPYAVAAQGDLETLQLSSDVANRLIDNKPSLAVEIGQVIDRRRKALREAGFTRS